MSSGPYGPPPGTPPPDEPGENPPQQPQQPQQPQPPAEQPSWMPPPPAGQAGPPGEAPPPSQTPPATPPQPVETPSWMPPPPPEYPPAGEGVAPSYYPPPGEAMAAPPRRRNVGALIAIVLVVVVVIAAIGGYLVAGVAFAQNRLSSANSAYNTVVDHQNDLNDTIKSLSDKITTTDVSTATSSDLNADKAAVSQIVSKSQAAQSQIDNDDASLAKADAGLKENQWLTVLRRGDMDKESTRIDHARKALAVAKVITSDYVQIGNFYQSFFDVLIDFDTLGTKAQSQDIAGVAAADEKIKADATKAISLDKAPGLPIEMDAFLKNVQALATDFTNLINAKTTAQVNAAEAAARADLAKIEATDWSKIGNDIDAFYKPLIDSYNSEVDKANAS